MNAKAKEFIEYVGNGMPRYNKAAAQQATQERFGLAKDRSVYHCGDFAVRFCYTKNGSFSNVVLSLSALQKYDHLPFFVVLVVGNGDNVLYLANTTLLNKISHSSQQLREDNVKGSFLGSNIIKEYDGIPNDAAHAEQLFAIHSAFSWQENLARLVEATSGIKPTKAKFCPDERQRENIYASVERAKAFAASAGYRELAEDLYGRVERNLQYILTASRIDNVNIRGRLIEYLITSEDVDILKDMENIESKLPVYDTHNGLGDYVRRFGGFNTYTDVKSKIMYLESSPKAYNVDKFLETMSEDDSVFLFYFVGIDESGLVNCVLCPVYDRGLLNATVFQFHWAGRGTRGVAQFDGKAIAAIIHTAPFVCEIDDAECRAFIDRMLER